MLRNVKKLSEEKPEALDGELSQVTDLTLDDEEWVIQHMGVGTRQWLSGKKVRISPGR